MLKKMASFLLVFAILLSILIVPVSATSGDGNLPIISFSNNGQMSSLMVESANVVGLFNFNDILTGFVYLVSLPAGSVVTGIQGEGYTDFRVGGSGSSWSSLDSTSPDYIGKYYLENGQFVSAPGTVYQDQILNYSDIIKEIPNSDVSGFAAYCVSVDTFEADVVIIQFGAGGAVENPSITVGSASGKPGDTVTIPVSIANNPGYAGYQGRISFDSTALTLTNVTGATTFNSETGAVSFAQATNITADGEILAATFKINDGAAYGTYPIGISFDEFYDASENDLSLEITSGKITVSAAGEGDMQDGYNVYLDTDKSVDQGKDVDVAVGIAGQGAGFDKYTNYRMIFTYNAQMLEFIGVTGLSEDDEVKAEASEGTLTICKYGTEEISSSSGKAFTLQFTAKAVGTVEVKCTGAGIGNKGTVEASDEIVANLLDDTTVITVTTPVEYDVTIDKGSFEATVTGDSKATAGQDYTFTVADPYYDYTFTATVGGKTVEVSEPDAEGNYTIAGADVTGPISITLTAMTPKTYAVAVKNADGEEVLPSTVDVTLLEAAPKYTADYVFTVTKAEGYVYAVSVTVGGETVELEPSENEETHVVTYTIAGADVKGDVVITVVKTVAQDVMVEFTGSGKDKVVGGATQTAKEGQDFTFTVSEDTVHYDYTVTAARGSTAVPVTPGENGAYTIAAANMTAGETPITVTVTETRNLHLQVLGSEYVKLDGTIAVLIRATANLFDDEVLVAASNRVMYYTEAESYKAGFEGKVSGVFVRLAFIEPGGRISDCVDGEKVMMSVTTGSAADLKLNYDYDVNLSERIDTNDAQLVWNMYNAQYTSSQPFNDIVFMKKFLLADTNKDLVLNVLDSGAIVNYIINGTTP